MSAGADFNDLVKAKAAYDAALQKIVESSDALGLLMKDWIFDPIKMPMSNYVWSPKGFARRLTIGEHRICTREQRSYQEPKRPDFIEDPWDRQ